MERKGEDESMRWTREERRQHGDERRQHADSMERRGGDSRRGDETVAEERKRHAVDMRRGDRMQFQPPHLSR